MKCTCESARREALAEAFREAAADLRSEAGECRRDRDHTAADELEAAAHRMERKAAASQRPGASAGSPVGLSQVPELWAEVERIHGALANAQNISTTGAICAASAITDCIEDDGYYCTVHPPLTYPGEDGGLDG